MSTGTSKSIKRKDSKTMNQLAVREENPPQDKTTRMITIAGLTIVVVAGLWWLYGREAKADEGEPKDTGPEVPDSDLYVSDDCKTVIEGDNWWLQTAGPKITEMVYQGYGAPILSNDPNVLNASMNEVVRQVLQPWTACASQVPWPDWYVADNPVPTPQQGQNRQQFYAQMDAHRDKFVNDELLPSMEKFPQLNNLIGKISTGVLAVYLDRYHFDPSQLTGVDEGTSQGLSTQQKSRLKAMGYNIDENTVELFQSHFNTVMMEWVGGDWYGAGLDIPVNNTMDNVTDDALAFAFRSSAKRGMPWAAMVAQATGVGPNGEPPKNAPNA